MFPLWLLFGIGGVLISAGGIMFDKYLLENFFDNEDESGPGSLLIFSSIFVIPVVMIVVVFGYSHLDLSARTGVIGIIAGAISGAWTLMYLLAMNRADVSKVIPIFQTVPIFGLIFGMLFLKEFLTFRQILAATTIMIGAIVLVRQKGAGRYGFDLTTLLLMAGASCLLALSQVIFKMVTIDANFWTATFWLGIGFALFGALLFFFVSGYRTQFLLLLKKRRAAILGVNAANELFDNVGELIFLAAIVLGPVALVQSLYAYEPVIVLLISAILARRWPAYFREDTSKSAIFHKLLGIATILVGSLILHTAT
jgi:uncharacterized membrane protein